MLSLGDEIYGGIIDNNIMFEYLDHVRDGRVDCYSVLLKIKVSDYLKLIELVYKNRGGIAGQRSPLRTKSAQRIRKRLIDDLIRGTVIPPIVIGVRLNDEEFAELERDMKNGTMSLFEKINKEEQVSIIDGMQRTTALFEALSGPKFDAETLIRLELWIAKTTNSLIYRMLVLNSGQIPWNIRKQLEVVFSQLKRELVANVEDLDLFDAEDESRRLKAGQYQANQFIELFMLFGARRISIDIQEQLAEEFARLDIIETTGNEGFTGIFNGVSQLLVDLDKAFSNLTTNTSDIELQRFKTGKHIFSSQPARAGFMVAAAQEIFGIPGIELPKEKQEDRFKTLQNSVNNFIKFLSDKEQPDLFAIIDLPTLDEQVDVKSAKVGAFEREFFFKSFKTFFELGKSDTLYSLTPCWRTSH